MTGMILISDDENKGIGVSYGWNCIY